MSAHCSRRRWPATASTSERRPPPLGSATTSFATLSSATDSRTRPPKFLARSSKDACRRAQEGVYVRPQDKEASMKAFLLSATAITFLAATTPAQAGRITIGSTLARSCYEAAESHRSDRNSIRTCDAALTEEALTEHD